QPSRGLRFRPVELRPSALPQSLAVRTRLRAIAARAHRTPRARVVLRVVEEGPFAVVRAAGFEPRPASIGDGGMHARDDAAERARDAGRRGDERGAVVEEAKLDPPAAGDVVEHALRRSRVDLDVV